MLKNILKRLFTIEKAKYTPKTPEEKELESYLRDERLRRIREKVIQFRRKKTTELIRDRALLNEKYKILKQKNIFSKNKFMWR